jgi:hypothetical protein
MVRNHWRAPTAEFWPRRFCGADEPWYRFREGFKQDRQLENKRPLKLRRQRSRLVAFTLVELLVVIGIIALLAGILMPALNNSRRQANTLKCASQLRQVAAAALLYANDYRQVIPRDNFAGGHFFASNLLPYLNGPVVDRSRETDRAYLYE